MRQKYALFISINPSKITTHMFSLQYIAHFNILNKIAYYEIDGVNDNFPVPGPPGTINSTDAYTNIHAHKCWFSIARAIVYLKFGWCRFNCIWIKCTCMHYNVDYKQYSPYRKGHQLRWCRCWFIVLMYVIVLMYH